MKHRCPIFACLALVASLYFAPSADAQFLWRWFGPKTPDKNPPAKSAQPDSRRVTEVNVEVAWLADPITFPYYLEAHAASTQLEVRGYVPNKAVRDHALRIAQVYSSLPVVDSIKEHPSLLVRPGQMSVPQLQNSVQSSLRAALPKQSAQLKVEIGNDGKVFVAGPVTNHEEKMAVSHALRRLHGCTSVQNLTTLPELAQNPPPDKTPIVKTSSGPAENKSKSWFSWPFSKSHVTTKDEPPLLDSKPNLIPPKVVVEAKKPTEGPILIPNLPEPRDPIKNEPAVVKVDVPAKTPALSVAEMQKRVQAACPKAKGVEVQYLTTSEVRITLELQAESDLSPTADRVFAMPELQGYKTDLQFKIGTP
jgi:BON domain